MGKTKIHVDVRTKGWMLEDGKGFEMFFHAGEILESQIDGLSRGCNSITIKVKEKHEDVQEIDMYHAKYTLTHRLSAYDASTKQRYDFAEEYNYISLEKYTSNYRLGEEATYTLRFGQSIPAGVFTKEVSK